MKHGSDETTEPHANKDLDAPLQLKFSLRTSLLRIWQINGDASRNPENKVNGLQCGVYDVRLSIKVGSAVISNRVASSRFPLNSDSK